MLILPNPLNSPFLRESSPVRASVQPTPAMLADHLARLDRKAARRGRVMASAVHGSIPVRWLRAEPRPSIQYEPAMATRAARDARLTPQSKALLQVLHARAGNGTTTATCKTTLAHIMRVCTRSIGRYVAELSRFGYITTRMRRGATGLYTGLVITVADTVRPCFRKTAWLSGWLAQNLPTQGRNPDRTELSCTNHYYKESHTETHAPPDG